MIKKILVMAKSDCCDNLLQTIEYLKEQKFTLDTLVVEGKYETIQKYQDCEAKYDLLIYDHNIQAGISILQNILNITPHKKILITSTSTYCSDMKGCEHCQANYNKIRLYSPIDKELLLDIIQSKKFECHNKTRCTKDISFSQRPYFF